MFQKIAIAIFSVNFILIPNSAEAAIRVFITSIAATTWTVPSDWSNLNTIEVIGGGASGNDGNGDGGGGGERQQKHGGQFAQAHAVVARPSGERLRRVAPHHQDGNVHEVQGERGLAGEQGDGVGQEGLHGGLGQQGEREDERTGRRNDDPVVGADLHERQQRDRGRQSAQEGQSRRRIPALTEIVEAYAVEEFGDDAQDPQAVLGPRQHKAEPGAVDGVQGDEQQRGERDQNPGPGPEPEREGGIGGEGQIGEPLRRQRPGRSVPERHALAREPRLDQQERACEVDGVEAARLESHAKHGGDEHQPEHGQEDDQVGRIDSGETRRQETSVTGRPLTLEIDVGQDEARQNEKDVHPQPGAIEQARAFRRQRPVELEVEQDDAEREKEPHAGERIEHVGKRNLRGAGSLAQVAPLCGRQDGSRSFSDIYADAGSSPREGNLKSARMADGA